MLTQAAASLARLQAYAKRLVPAHLVCPAMLTSLRADDVPDSWQAAVAGGTRAKRSCAVDGGDGSGLAAGACCSLPGCVLWHHGGQQVVTLLPDVDLPPPSASLAAAILVVNPLALLVAEGAPPPPAGAGSSSRGGSDDDDSDHDDSDHDHEEEEEEEVVAFAPVPRPEGFSAVVAHLNFGNDDLASTCRVVIQYPPELEDAARAFRKLTSASSTPGQDPGPRPVIMAAWLPGGGAEAARMAAFVSALLYAGTLTPADLLPAAS